MKPGDGILKVQQMLRGSLLPGLLTCNAGQWNSVVVEEFPKRERLAVDLPDYSISLNMLHECKAVKYRPEPRPTATYVVAGQAEVGIACGSHGSVECARFVVSSGSFYELVEPLAWHFFRPVTPVALTLRVTWEAYHPTPYVYSKPPRVRCTPERHRELLHTFREAFHSTFGTRYSWQPSELEGDEG